MAGYRYRLGAIVAALGLVFTVSATSSATAYSSDTTQTVTTQEYFWGNLVIDFTIPIRASDLAVPAAVDQRSVVSSRHPVEHRDYHPIRERASRAAVRPSAVAGWRSGRVKRLAAA